MNCKGICIFLNPLPHKVNLNANMFVDKLSTIEENSIFLFANSITYDDADNTCNANTDNDDDNNNGDDNDDDDNDDDNECPCAVNSMTSLDYDNILKVIGVDLRDCDLNEAQRSQLGIFIAQTRDMVANDTSELGCTHLHMHKIETGDHSTQRQQRYRAGPQVKIAMEEQIEDMLENDIIEHSTSYWVDPVVMCKKKDDSLRVFSVLIIDA